MSVMQKITLLIFALFFYNNIQAQEIGEKAEIIEYLIKQNYNQRVKEDLQKYGKLQYTYGVEYDGEGLIDEITVNEKDVVFYYLQAKLGIPVKSDVTIIYNITYGRLSQIITTYHNISLKHIKEMLDEQFGHRNHGFDMYFTVDYQKIRFIYSDGNNPVVLYSKYEPSAAESFDFHNLIRKKQEEYSINKDSK